MGAERGIFSAFAPIMMNPYFLIIFAICLIIFAVIGLAILVTMPHLIVAIALGLMAIVVMASPRIMPGKYLSKLIIGLVLLFLAISIYVWPDAFGIMEVVEHPIISMEAFK